MQTRKPESPSRFQAKNKLNNESSILELQDFLGGRGDPPDPQHIGAVWAPPVQAILSAFPDGVKLGAIKDK